MEWIFNSLYFIIPLILAPIHWQLKKRRKSIFQYIFFYLLIFCVILKALPIAATMLFQGKYVAQVNNWAYCPIYTQFGLAMLSMGIAAIIGIFFNNKMRLMSAAPFLIFLAVAAISHLFQLQQPECQQCFHTMRGLIVFDLLTVVFIVLSGIFALRSECRAN